MSSNIVVKSEVRKIVVKNADGKDGKSAYQQSVEGGYTGTEHEFNCSLSLLADVAEGKKQIADAINTKGGEASADSSFQQLASDIENLNDSFITYGVKADPKIDWVKYMCRSNVEARRGLLEIDRDDITTITNDNVFRNSINLQSVNMQNLTSVTGINTFQGCTSLQEVKLPNLTTISGGNTFLGCTSLQEIKLPNLTTISGINTFQACSSLQNVTFPNLTTISAANCFAQCESTKKVKLPNITIISAVQTFWGCSSLEAVTFGTLTTLVETFRDNSLNLRSITIGQGTNINLQFQKWIATNVIAEGQSGIDELNSNLYNNLLTKLADHSTDGQTRTLRLGWLAHVTQENIDYANSKGWTLTT